MTFLKYAVLLAARLVWLMALAAALWGACKMADIYVVAFTTGTMWNVTHTALYAVGSILFVVVMWLMEGIFTYVKTHWK